MNNILQAILRTLTYAEVFNYPLTIKEIYRYLIAEREINFETLQKKLAKKNQLINSAGEYFFLRGKKKIVTIRKKRENWSQKKLKIAQRVSRWLRLISAIKMVAVTGALAMKNSDQNDDIDLLIVSAQNRLWLTRLWAVFLVELVAKRRRPGDRNFKDKICLNMFLDEDHLRVPEKEQSLFTAHEVCQLRPLWSKEGVYNRFVEENKWVKKYLPNWKL